MYSKIDEVKISKYMFKKAKVKVIPYKKEDNITKDKVEDTTEKILGLIKSLK